MKQKIFNVIITCVLIGVISVQSFQISNFKNENSKLKNENEIVTTQLSATRLATSNDSLQQSVEVEAAERKTQDEKLSKSIGSSINTLQGYIGTSSTSNIADGTLRGAIGNTSIAGIGTSNNITSAISGLNTNISNILNGTSIVPKASKDASGNVIVDTYLPKTTFTKSLNEVQSIHCGSSVVLCNGTNEVKFLDRETACSRLGISNTYTDNGSSGIGDMFVFASNGHLNACNAKITGTFYYNGYWWVTLDRVVANGTRLRINYMVVKNSSMCP